MDIPFCLSHHVIVMVLQSTMLDAIFSHLHFDYLLSQSRNADDPNDLSPKESLCSSVDSVLR